MKSVREKRMESKSELDGKGNSGLLVNKIYSQI